MLGRVCLHPPLSYKNVLVFFKNILKLPGAEYVCDVCVFFVCISDRVYIYKCVDMKMSKPYRQKKSVVFKPDIS